MSVSFDSSPSRIFADCSLRSIRSSINSAAFVRPRLRRVSIRSVRTQADFLLSISSSSPPQQPSTCSRRSRSAWKVRRLLPLLLFESSQDSTTDSPFFFIPSVSTTLVSLSLSHHPLAARIELNPFLCFRSLSLLHRRRSWS